MLPLQLSIEGVYSYQEKQEIDFENLTDVGLFGVFGNVGSGKSTILEAIGFVLYGSTERMNAQDKRSYNMLNLKSSKAKIDFEFLNFANTKYKFVAEWSRKKVFHETTPIDRKAYKWSGTEWIPLDTADATEIVGLSYDNFKRTIIIPQGKFKEFLELKGKDRSEMMKEIFHLHRFDLGGKIATLKAKTKSDFDVLSGKLEGFEEISEGAIDQKSKEIEGNVILVNDKKNELDKVVKVVQELKKLKDLVSDNEKNKLGYTALSKQKPEMDELNLKIQEYESVSDKFKFILGESKNVGVDLLQTTKDKKVLLESKIQLETKSAEISEKLNVLQVEIGELPNNKQKVLDYLVLVKLKENDSGILNLQEQLEVILREIKEFDASDLILKNEHSLLINAAEELKAKRTDPSIFLQLADWYNNQDSFLSKQSDSTKNLSKINKEIDAQRLVFENFSLDLSSWKETVEAKKVANQKELISNDLVKSKLLISKEIAHISSRLHEGENCPVCGSLDHPNILKADDISVQLDTVLKQEKLLKDEENKLLKVGISANHAFENLERFTKDLKELEQLAIKLNEEVALHGNSFIWETYEKEDRTIFEQRKAAFQSVEKAIQTNELEVTAITKKRDENKLKIDQKKEVKAEIDINTAQLNGVKENNLAQLISLNWENFQNTSIAVIKHSLGELKNKNEILEIDFIAKKNEFSTVKEGLALVQGSIVEVSKRELSLSEKSDELAVKIAELVKVNGYESIAFVKNILISDLNVQLERKKHQQFEKDLQSHKALLDESTKRLEGRVFNDVEFKISTEQEETLRLGYDKFFSEHAKLEGALKILKDQFVHKQGLLVEFNLINNRLDNIKTLENLFNGNGFVNYVSSIYLKNLADNANARFHRITKNQLSLIINANNEFEVIDYLNNGATRSVKTLSGGQAFQASLCLALALAESVNSFNKNSKNFFFIDEGFGTQDAESVALVYDTLQSLLKENRIVGFISHLTELQERIPKSITILKDDEKGSFIKMN